MKALVILFIVTSHVSMGEGLEPTGVWLEELTTPYYEFVDAGYEVKVASVAGGEIPIDPRSLGESSQEEESVKRYFNDAAFQEKVKNAPKAADLDTSQYAAIVFPGGHGTMWDYPNNPDLSNIITTALSEDRVVAAICHGPAVFVGVEDENGEPLVKGKKIAAFTDSEEAAVGLAEEVPFLLETKLQTLGAEIVKVGDFESISVVDGNIVTGQNPASSKAVAKDVIQLLEAKSK